MDKRHKIILIAPTYFGYHKIIIDSLINKGHEVDFIEDKNSGFRYALSTKSQFLLNKYKKRYRDNILSILNKKQYDYMIVIGGRTLDADFSEYIKSNYSFKMILYQWDSLKNFDYKPMIPFFDAVKTFDRVDAESLGIAYLPLFYKKEEETSQIEDIDLLFVGIWHSDRIQILNKIASFAIELNLNYTFKVYYPRYMYYYMMYIKRSLPSSDFFFFKPMSSREVASLYRRAKCIVDINHPDQSGLTMRTIETVGKGKKLLTTNSYILKEEFYDDKMIQLIDRSDVNIKSDFLNLKVNYRNIERLEISNWVNELID